MILAALESYYQRRKDLPPFGMQYKPIAFVVVLSASGEWVGLEDTRNEAGRPQLFLVPQAVQRTSAPVANWAWDNVSYTFQLSQEVLPWVEEKLQVLNDLSVQMDNEGQVQRMAQIGERIVLLPPSLQPGGGLLKDLPQELKPTFRLWKEETCSHVEGLTEAVPENCVAEQEATYTFSVGQMAQHRNRANYLCFKEQVQRLYKAHPEHPSLQALYQFYQQDWWHQLWSLQRDPLWNDFKNRLQTLVAFRVEGHAQLIAQEIQPFLPLAEEKKAWGRCSVSGRYAPLACTHAPVPILGSQPTARLVSFQRHVGYESYGKSRHENAPVSEQTEFAYTTALNSLLRPDSLHQFRAGNRTYVFWLSAVYPAEEELLREILYCLAPYKGTASCPLTKDLILLYQRRSQHVAAWENKERQTLWIHFMGLFPNSARIALSFEHHLPVLQVLKNFCLNLQDAIWAVPSTYTKPYYAYTSLLQAVAVDNQLQNLPPKWADEVLQAFLLHEPCSDRVYRSCIHQMMRSGSLLYAQLSCLKYGLRVVCGQSIQACLNVQNRHPYYLLGRFMAGLEKVSSSSFSHLGFRYRYWASALLHPFPTFKEWLRKYPPVLWEGHVCEKMLLHLQSLLLAQFLPQQPSQEQQALFIMGYAQQIQAFVGL